MCRFAKVLMVALVAAVLAAPAMAQQVAQERQPDPNSPRYKGLVALSEFVGSEGDAAVAEFMDARIAPSVRAKMGDEALNEALVALRAAAHGAEMRGGRPVSPLAAEIMFAGAGGEIVVSFELDESDTDRFIMIRSADHEIG